VLPRYRHGVTIDRLEYLTVTVTALQTAWKRMVSSSCRASGVISAIAKF